MEQFCPLYFPLYPPSYLLPGLKEYLGDPTPLATTVQPGQLTNPPSIREEEDVHHELSNSKNFPLLVGSRKLVFLHATTSEWCRRRGKRSEGRKGGAVDDRGRGWAVSDEKSIARGAAAFEGGVLVSVNHLEAVALDKYSEYYIVFLIPPAPLKI